MALVASASDDIFYEFMLSGVDEFVSSVWFAVSLLLALMAFTMLLAELPVLLSTYCFVANWRFSVIGSAEL